MITDASQISPDMQAYFNASLWPAERNRLAELANASEGQYIIEIGVFRGETTKYLAENTNKAILAIDPYEMTDNNNEDIKAKFYENCEPYLKSGRIIHIQSRSEDAHKFLTKHVVGNSALVFIDWDGTMEQHYQDIVDYSPYLSESGYLAIHDFFDIGASGKGDNIAKAIDMYMKYVEKPVIWESMLYYPKYTDMKDSMLFYKGDPDYFYSARSRGLIWSRINS